MTKAASQNPDDGTEATANRHIWHEVFENDIVLNVQQAEALLGEKSGWYIDVVISSMFRQF